MSTPGSCKDGASKSNNIGVCEMNDMLQNMSTVDKDVSVCANCGKEGSDVNNICNKCKMVKYCNAACKKKHRHKHKKQCEEHVRLAAERAAELHDEKLFKLPPPLEDSPICFLRLPSLGSGKRYQTCCGKVICSGCIYAPLYDHKGNKVDNQKCPFCRVTTPNSAEDAVKRNKKRVEAGDAKAMYNYALYYYIGEFGFQQDPTKTLEVWHRAAELGNAQAYGSIGNAYDHGRGVEVDHNMATHYYELAAMRGDEYARYNLGHVEIEAGNYDRALKHLMMSVKGGSKESLEKIKQLYTNGHATKDDYTTALQSYQAYLGEIKSAQRDEAATACEDYRYY